MSAMISLSHAALKRRRRVRSDRSARPDRDGPPTAGRGPNRPLGSRGQSYPLVTLVGAVTLFEGSLTLVMSNFIS